MEDYYVWCKFKPGFVEWESDWFLFGEPNGERMTLEVARAARRLIRRNGHSVFISTKNKRTV